MTAANLFLFANTFALGGWIVLIYAVIRKHDWLRDQVAGYWWPIGLSVLYASLIVLFFGQSEGGFDTLENVKKLFTSDWAMLAGWVHYLAFDLFIGAWIARECMAKGMSRLWLIILLPATFMFGPAGLLTFTIIHNSRNRSGK